MEFPADYYQWSKLSRGLDCCLSPPGGTEPGYARTVPEAEMGKPLVVTAWLRSRSGLDQTVPSTYYRKDPENGPALLSGIDIKLEYSAEKPAEPYNPYRDRRKWEEVKPVRAAHFKATGAGKTLTPTGEFEAFELDLNAWFDISKAGYYRVNLVFAAEPAGFAEGKSHPAVFILREAGKGKAGK
jgi:hypothetical protein